MKKIIKHVKFRRRRESATNYKKRFGIVKGGITRVVFRKTNSMIIGQAISYSDKGDVIEARADSKELAKMKWPSRANRATAYLTGYLLGKKLGSKGKKEEYILDIGLNPPIKNSLSFVFAKGCKDAGLNIRGSFDIKEELYNYSDTGYASSLKKNKSGFEKQYGRYLKEGHDPESLGKLFNETKKALSEIKL
jgi:large subunit ribosomal protein L18